MQTLLEKVTNVEETAKENIKRAEEAGQKALNDLLANEDQAMTAIRQESERRVEAIMKEKIDQIENEINALRQQGESSIKMIHVAADKNRLQALKTAWYLLQEEYLK